MVVTDGLGNVLPNDRQHGGLAVGICMDQQELTPDTINRLITRIRKMGLQVPEASVSKEACVSGKRDLLISKRGLLIHWRSWRLKNPMFQF